MANSAVVRSMFVDLVLRDRASQGLIAAEKNANQYQQQIRGMSAANKEAEGAAGNTADALKQQAKQTEEAKKHSDSLKSALLGVGAALTTVGVAGTLYFSNAAKNYGKYATAITAYNNMAGESAAQTLAQLQQITKGAIANADLVLSANKAMAMGITQDALPRLAEIATAAGKVLGEDTAFMFDSIVTGIARGSPLILDNLGIIVSIGEANEKYAEALGKSANALTEDEQQQALLNAVLESGQVLIDKAGSTAETAASSYAKMQAAAENMNLAMGNAVSGPMTAWYSLLTNVANAISSLPQPLVNVIGVIGIAATSISSLLGPMMLQVAGLIALRASWASLKAEMATVPAFSAVAAASMTPLIGSLYATAAAAWAAITPLLPFIGIAAAIAGVAAAVDYGVRGDESFVGSLFSNTSAVEDTAGTVNNITINQTNNVANNNDITTNEAYTLEEIENLLAREQAKWTKDTTNALARDLRAVL